MLPGMTMQGLADGSGGGGGGGGGGAAVSFVNRNAYASAVTPSDVTAQWSVNNAGTESSSGEAGRTWRLSGVSGDYQLFVADTGGGLTSGTVGSWLLLSTTRTYSVTRTSNIADADSTTLDCQVRRTSDSVVIATFQVTITAEVQP